MRHMNIASEKAVKETRDLYMIDTINMRNPRTLLRLSREIRNTDTSAAVITAVIVVQKRRTNDLKKSTQLTIYEEDLPENISTLTLNETCISSFPTGPL